MFFIVLNLYREKIRPALPARFCLKMKEPWNSSIIAKLIKINRGIKRIIPIRARAASRILFTLGRELFF